MTPRALPVDLSLGLSFCLVVLLAPATAHAHFALDEPQPYSMQDSLGLPEKSAPCGQADPGAPVVATNRVTSYHVGDTITLTIDEKIFHPGHYRVALAADQSSLPVDPVVTAGDSPCGSAVIQDASVTGVVVDNMLPHTTQFSAPQSFQVTMPATPCMGCTLQVIEFMSDHSLNDPGGCFYHHCATVNVLPAGAAIPPGTEPGSGSGGSGSDPTPVGSPPPPSGCGVAGVGGGAAGLIALAGVAIVLRRRRRA